MCPACLASLGMLLAAATAGTGALTALLTTKIRPITPDSRDQPRGGNHARTEDRIQG